MKPSSVTIIYTVAFLSWAGIANAQSYLRPNFEYLAERTERIDFQELGFSQDEIPSKFDLTQYCPPVSSQEGSSCVGFALCYGAMSIMHNVVDDRTDFAERLFTAFDPYFLYASVNDKNDMNCYTCECGTLLTQGLDFLKVYGSKKYWVSPDISCNTRIASSDLGGFGTRISNYRIDEYYSLVDYTETSSGWSAKPDIEAMKKALASYYPLVGGLDVDQSFASIDSRGAYQPKQTLGNQLDGHAITIVGYNDSKFGGAFLVLNSYGSDWGEDGYFWLTYKDALKYLNECYFLYREDGFKGWSRDIEPSSFDKYYCRVNEGVELYEGGVGQNGYYHGSCYQIVKGNFAGAGSYQNGYPHGTWLICDFATKDDFFFGYVEFEDGEVIDMKALGFAESARTTNNEAEELLELLGIELENKRIQDYTIHEGMEKTERRLVSFSDFADDSCIYGAKDKPSFEVTNKGGNAKLIFKGGWSADFAIELDGILANERPVQVYFIKDSFCAGDQNVIVIDDEVYGVSRVEKLK